MVLLSLVCASFAAIALMSGRPPRGGRAVRGRGLGRGLGRGRGTQAVRGLTWNRNGDHAKAILRGYLGQQPAFATWNAFKAAHASWILTEQNPSGYYVQDNLCRNYKETLKRYHKHIDPNDPYDGASLASFFSFQLFF